MTMEMMDWIISAHYPTNVGVLILGIDTLIKFIFEWYCIILVFYRNNFSFHTPWHVFPPHLFMNNWSTYSNLNPSTVTMVVFFNNMVWVKRFMKMFFGVDIITHLLNMSVARGKRWWISSLGPRETFLSGLCALDTQKLPTVVCCSFLYPSLSHQFFNK